MQKDPAHTNQVDAPVPTMDLPAPERVRGDGPTQPRLTGVLHSLHGRPSRRDVLRGLAATGLGLGLAAFPALAEAQPKRRKQRKRLTPAKPNRFSCLEVNDPCRRHLQCCSGRCRGKRGRRRCRAHGNGTCNQTAPAICEAVSPMTTFCNNSPSCLCTRTTAGSSFCGETTGLLDRCTSCKRDADCVKLGFPPGSACAPIATGNCAGTCPTGMVCMAPCGSVPPAPPPAP